MPGVRGLVTNRSTSLPTLGSVNIPVVIAHRGASGYRPEHTLAAYRLAIEMGADFIEPDVVPTKDGALVARHENELSATTDVAIRPEFADRRMTKVVDGVVRTGWFTEDFSLPDLKTLQATPRLPRLCEDWLEPAGIPTLQEVVDLAMVESRRLGRVVGVCPELKHPAFAGIGLPIEPLLVELLDRNDLDSPGSPVLVQCFAPASLLALRDQLAVPLLQLVGTDPRRAGLVTPAGLAAVACYADAIGVHKDLVISKSAQGALRATTSLVPDGHREGLQVHAWTFADENASLPLDYRRGADPHARGNPVEEYAAFYRAGVDGVFSDHPDTALRALDLHLRRAG
jgi:glycerophosphoryl diester phosphodiesterase